MVSDKLTYVLGKVGAWRSISENCGCREVVAHYAHVCRDPEEDYVLVKMRIYKSVNALNDGMRDRTVLNSCE